MSFRNIFSSSLPDNLTPSRAIVRISDEEFFREIELHSCPGSTLYQGCNEGVKMRFRILLLLSCFPVLIYSETYIQSGSVSGIWTFQDHPYLIEGQINIPADQSLIIEPGVEVIFQGHYKFLVYGKITAIGTENDSIRFNATDTGEGWHGLRFIDTETNGQNGSIIAFCVFEYGNALTSNEENSRGGALSCSHSSDLQILCCRFSHNQADYGGAIELRYSDVIINYCLIDNNYASHDGGGLDITNESETFISNTTIQNNSCYFNGGGIYCCNYASLTLNDVIIKDNLTTCNDQNSTPGGAGISCRTSTVELNNVIITGNISINYGRGGGIECYYDASMTFTNGCISNNKAHWGGGISNNGIINLAGVTISYNAAEEYGGGLYQQGNANFNPDNRCNIYYNYSSGMSNIGYDLFSYNYCNVMVDTFTVMVPTELQASPIENFGFDILHAKVNQTVSDVYVSPFGSDDNSGLTPDDPLLTIFCALQKILPDSLNHLTIFLAEGTYSPSATGEVFPIKPIDHITIEGDSQSATILNADETATGLYIYGNEDVVIKNLTVMKANGNGFSGRGSEFTIQNISFLQNSEGSSVIYLRSCSIANLTDVIIADNLGNGLFCYFVDPYLSGVSIHDNNGYGAYFNASLPVFDSDNRCSIYLNSFTVNGQDLGAYNCTVNAVLDTFTVLEPVEYFVRNIDNFTFDILHAKVETVDADVYVSPFGSDENSGLSADEPLKTIYYAYLKCRENSQNPHTIHLAEGIYSPSQNGETYPLRCRSYFTLSGTSKNTTILDAEQNGQVLNCFYSHSAVQNLTVTNGSASGIYLNYFEEDCLLDELIIENNHSNAGGGIYSHNCEPDFSNLIIKNNSSQWNGGGLYFHNSDATLNNVTIKSNFAGEKGGGIYCNSSNPVFSNDVRSNIFLNQSATGFARDIYSTSGYVTVIVDTFTVEFPDNYYAQPIGNFNFDILHHLVQQIDQDVYVSPVGSDLNSGLTPDEPFKTISFALSRIASNNLNPHTIHLTAGTYSPGATGETYPLHSKNYLTIQGADRETTILDAEEQARVIYCHSDHFILEKMTICNGDAFAENTENDDGGGIKCVSGINIEFNDLLVKDNIARKGGGIYNSASGVVIEDVVIRDNEASWYGGGLHCSWGPAALENVIIQNNTALYAGGGIYYEVFSELQLLNVSICNNHVSNGYGGGLYLITDDKVMILNATFFNNSASESGGGVYIAGTETLLLNSICWNNSPEEIYIEQNSNADFEINFSNLEGGYNSIINNGNGQVIWGYHNIEADPLFINPDEGNINLHHDSPCIDAGTAFYQWDDEVIFDLAPDEYYGDAPDMGAFEWEGVDVQDEELSSYLPLISQFSNYPNPFNPLTTIRFNLNRELNDPDKLEVTIYNVKGQKVKTLPISPSQSRTGFVVWDGTDNSNQPVSSGVYFYQLKSGKFEKTKKCMLMK